MDRLQSTFVLGETPAYWLEIEDKLDIFKIRLTSKDVILYSDDR